MYTKVPFVPLLDFSVGKFCVSFQVVEDLWLELTVLLPHCL